MIIAALPACSSRLDKGAERVFVNGAIYTADEERSWAEAIAIKDGEIIFVGSNNVFNPYLGNDTEVTDLDGKMLMPGFHDAHAHVRFGGLSESECNLQDEFDQADISDTQV